MLAHVLTTPEAGGPRHNAWFSTYNGEISAASLMGTWSGYRDKRLTPERILAYGYGGGGGGPTREMPAVRRRLDRLPGLPRVRTDRAGAYFARRAARIEREREHMPERVPVWDGELYLEYHRGTYTSQAGQKRRNRKLELGLRTAEWLNALSGAVGAAAAADRQVALDVGWQVVLRNQFHDILPGSGIREVYEDSAADLAEAAATADVVRQGALADLGHVETAGMHVMLNTAGWRRRGIVAVPRDDASAVVARDRSGRIRPSQRVGDVLWLECEDLPPLGWTTVTLSASTEARAPDADPFLPDLAARRLRTPLYDLEWNGAGHWTRLFDRQAGREVLAPGGLGNVFEVYEDKPLDFDAWDIDLFYREKRRSVDDLESVELIGVGPIACMLRFVWRVGRSRVEQDVVLYAHSRRIDCRTRIAWHERQTLLKVAFAVDVRNTEATYDIQFGNLRRPTHTNTPSDSARFEVVGHQWADLSEAGYGVSLLNDSKYGQKIHGNVMRLSLLKSALYPDPEADQGEHLVTYALLPHLGDWLEADTVAEASDLNDPIEALPGRLATDAFSLVGTTAKVHVDAVKLGENGRDLVIRLHDFSGGRQRVALELGVPTPLWQEVNLLEQALACPPRSPAVLFVRPPSIRTLRFPWTAPGRGDAP